MYGSFQFQYKIITKKQQLLGIPSEDMKSQANDLNIHAFSAFRRTCEPQNMLNQTVAQLQAFTQQTINLKKKVPFSKSNSYFNTTHPLTHMLIDLIYSLKTELQRQDQKSPSMTSSIGIIQIPMTLFKNVCVMIHQSLFQIQCKYSWELTSSMLFQRGLIQTFKLCYMYLSSSAQQSNLKLSYAYLDQILNCLLQGDYRKIFIKNIYTLQSGSMSGIQRNNFSQNLKCIITNIGKVFTQKTNLITRNLKNIKKSKFVNQIVTNSIKNICNYKNQQYISQEVNRVTQAIFGEQRLQLSKEQFIEIVSGIINSQSKENSLANSCLYTVFLYIDLFRVEVLMIHDSQLKVNIQKQKQVNSTNFYTQQMQKLLKKCPYNGDQCCDCKKCQCVRRNRQSAKLSQQKKRNAVEQLDPMKKRIQELQRRNKQLQQQNKILRGIVSQLKNSQNTRSNFNCTIESVSKVLQN